MAISRSIRTAVGAIAVGLMFASASQAAVLIDTFNVGGFALQAPPTTGSNTITQNSLPDFEWPDPMSPNLHGVILSKTPS